MAEKAKPKYQVSYRYGDDSWRVHSHVALGRRFVAGLMSERMARRVARLLNADEANP